MDPGQRSSRSGDGPERAQRRGHDLPVALLVFGLALSTAATWGQAAEDPLPIVVSLKAATTMGSTVAGDRDLVSFRVDGTGLQVLSDLDDALPDGVDVDAMSQLQDGRLVFSTDVSFHIPGVDADDEDLVVLDGGDLSLLVDLSAFGVPESADVDALHVVSVDPLDILYSVDAPARVEGVIFTDDDIIRFNARSHTLFLAGSEVLGDEALRADVDALWYDQADDEVVLSLDVAIPSAQDRTAADAEDLVRWSGGALGMYLDASAVGLSGPGLDLDAVTRKLELCFADGFETGDTRRWSATEP